MFTNLDAAITKALDVVANDDQQGEYNMVTMVIVIVVVLTVMILFQSMTSCSTWPMRR